MFIVVQVIHCCMYLSQSYSVFTKTLALTKCDFMLNSFQPFPNMQGKGFNVTLVFNPIEVIEPSIINNINNNANKQYKQ